MKSDSNDGLQIYAHKPNKLICEYGVTIITKDNTTGTLGARTNYKLVGKETMK
jgi:hypothetical protein